MVNNLYHFFTILAIIFIVIFLAYYTTYIIGKKSNNLFRKRCVQVIERTALGYNLSIYVLKVKGKIYILAVQNRNIQLVDTIDEKEWNGYKMETQTTIDGEGQSHFFSIFHLNKYFSIRDDKFDNNKEDENDK